MLKSIFDQTATRISRCGTVCAAIAVLVLMTGCDPCMNNPCNDGVACNGVETCTVTDGAAVCGDGTPVECAAGETCTEPDGTCSAADPCADVTCDAGQTCVDGQCVTDDPCADVTCDAGQTCVDGQCVTDDPCAGVTCGAGETCVDGVCVADGGLTGDPVAGEAFFSGDNCGGCHAADGSGGFGPSLIGVSADEIFDHLTGVVTHTGGTRDGFTEQDAADLAAWLAG